MCSSALLFHHCICLSLHSSTHPTNIIKHHLPIPLQLSISSSHLYIHPLIVPSVFDPSLSVYSFILYSSPHLYIPPFFYISPSFSHLSLSPSLCPYTSPSLHSSINRACDWQRSKKQENIQSIRINTLHVQNTTTPRSYHPHISSIAFCLFNSHVSNSRPTGRTQPLAGLNPACISN